MRIRTIRSTDLFTGTAGSPRQVVRVTLEGGDEPEAGPVRIRVDGPAVTTPEPAEAVGLAAGEERTVEVGVVIAAPATEGSVQRVTATAQGPSARAAADGTITAAATGWTMWMVSHFHYDPVWWNTQAGFTEVWHQLPDVPWVGRLRPPHARTAFDLVRAHLEAARHDEDYRFVLAEIDYLKPHWDAFPGDRADLRRFLREDRIELVGGSYNEPNTNLTHPESTIRNTVYGVGYQRDVLGGDPRSGWLLDVFGHDPAHPGLMADAGLDSSAWARGPFHNSGPIGHAKDITRMQFPSEFEWMAPSGRGVLTHYMGAHYTAGWAIHRTESLEEAMAAAYGQYAELKKVAATRNVMLPVGHDHNVPSRWCTEIHREWARRYVWPRFTMGLPREFFSAVRRDSDSGAADAAGGGGGARARRVVTTQTRDMNPVFTGKDVSYIDTKQAQRAAETAVLDAERLATLAALLGERFPAEALDKAWRQLAYGAHHDAVTGTESDQVYLDLVGGWREAYDLGGQARDNALQQLADRTDTRGEGRPVLVANTQSWQRDGVVTVPAAPGTRVSDDTGQPVQAVRDGDTLTFLAREVPSLGHRVYRLTDAGAETEDGTQDPANGAQDPRAWAPVPGATHAANDRYRVEADPERGGALVRITDLRTGQELLRPGGLGAEPTLQDEYVTHPVWGEGPWHLLPKGAARRAGGGRGTVRVEHSPAGQRIVSESRLDGLRLTLETTLWHGVDRIDFRLRTDGTIGEDQLLRVRFDLDLPGTLPVSEVGFAAIGRPFGFPESDTAEHLWTLDNPAHTWAGLSTTARVALHGTTDRDGEPLAHAFGVAEVIASEDRSHDLRPLLARLVAQGVTATSAHPDGPRHGSLDADSNLPDIRLSLGTDNAFTERVLAASDPAYRQALTAHGRVFVPADRPRAEAWTPGADLRGPRDLPVLIALDIAALTEDVEDGVVDVTVPAGLPVTDEPAAGYSVALVNHGTPSSVATTDGTLHLTLMRACTDWPNGVWLDGARRTAPDGSGFALQHWTHDFRFSLVSGPGDWRDAGFARHGREANHPLLALPTEPHDGVLPARTSLLSVEPDNVLLSAFKPRGNPMASALAGDADPAADGVIFRLYESQGRPTRAHLRLHGGLVDGEATDLLEQAADDRGPVVADAAGDGLMVPLGAADVVTVAARPLLTALPQPVLPPVREPAQPVFTRYWLHNTGPAPVGNLPTSVNLSTAEHGDDPAEYRITVAASARPAEGTVELDVPPGLTATPSGPLDYDLAPGEHAEFALTVRPDADAAPGTYFFAARIRDDLGQLLEDALPVHVSTPEEGDSLDAELTHPSLDRLVLRLTNRARSSARGEALLISPFGTWGAPDDDLAITPRTQGFDVPAGGTAELSYTVRGSARRGAEYWALAKVASFGRVQFTETIRLTADDLTSNDRTADDLTADGRCRSTE